MGLITDLIGGLSKYGADMLGQQRQVDEKKQAEMELQNNEAQNRKDLALLQDQLTTRQQQMLSDLRVAEAGKLADQRNARADADASYEGTVAGARQKATVMANLDPAVVQAQVAADSIKARGATQDLLDMVQTPGALEAMTKKAFAQNPALQAQIAQANAAASASLASAATSREQLRGLKLLTDAKVELATALANNKESDASAAAMRLKALSGGYEKLGDAEKAQLGDLNKQVEETEKSYNAALANGVLTDKAKEEFQARRDAIKKDQNRVYARAGLLDDQIPNTIQGTIDKALKRNADPMADLDLLASKTAADYGGKYAQKMQAAVEQAKAELSRTLPQKEMQPLRGGLINGYRTIPKPSPAGPQNRWSLPNSLPAVSSDTN